MTTGRGRIKVLSLILTAVIVVPSFASRSGGMAGSATDPGAAGKARRAEPDHAGKLGPFLRRVATGTSRTRGPLRETIPALSERSLRTLPPHVQVERHGPEPVLHIKARLDDRVAGEEVVPAGTAGSPAGRSLASIGVEVRARVGSIASLSVPVSALDRLAALPEVTWLRAAHSYNLQNEVSTGPAHVDSDDAVANLMTGGAGVIVAVVDTGIDWGHADFRNADDTTRILGIWDQTLSDPGHPPPPGFSFGAYYTAAEIDATLAAGGTLATGDGHGHGTHVAGSAAGNGRGTGNGVPAGTFAGVAPEADLLIVRVFDDGGGFCSECDLTAAVGFISQVASDEDKPWVGNMSLGSNFGAHDGTDPDELTIDALVGPGRTGAQLAVAAGNSGAQPVHWEGTLTTGMVREEVFTVPNYTAASGSDNDFIWIDLWYGGDARMRVEVDTPGGVVVGADPGSETGVVCTDSGAVLVDALSAPDPLNGDNRAVIQIWDSSECSPSFTPQVGGWTLRLRAEQTPVSGTAFDAWNEATIGSGWVTFSSATPFGTVGIPGTGRHALTAGSYVSKNQWINAGGSITTITNITVGALSAFSGLGPTRDGRTKPDVAAPGEWVGSTLTGGIGASRGTFFTERDGVHGDIRGTSMATPHVAGTAALVLAVNRDLLGPEVRAALQRGARSDAQTGTTPNDLFGAGKLNALEASYQAATIVTGVVATAAGGFSAPGNQFAQQYNVYRGTLQTLSTTFYGDCLLQGLVSPDFNDADTPASGGAFFYLTTGERDGAEGILGVDSDGSIRPNNAACL